MSSLIYKRPEFYSDGITRSTEPFWKMVCESCGKTYMSCVCYASCTRCGSRKYKTRTLGERTYEDIVAERGEPTIPEHYFD